MQKVTRHGGGESGESLFQSNTAEGVRCLPPDGEVRKGEDISMK
jgi:hypothetical protein